MAIKKELTYNWKYATITAIGSVFLIWNIFYCIIVVHRIPILTTYWTPLFILTLLWIGYSVYSLIKIYWQDQYFISYMGFHGAYLTLLTYSYAFEIGHEYIHLLFLALSIFLAILYNIWVRFVKRKKEEGSERHSNIYKVIRNLPPIAILFSISITNSYNRPLDVGEIIFDFCILILTGNFASIYIADWLEQRKYMIVN